MQTGAIISGWGHLVIIGFAALSGPIFQEETENIMSVSEISVVSLSEFDILQEKFLTDDDNSKSLIDAKQEESALENTAEADKEKDSTKIDNNEIVDGEIAKTSTPSIDSPALPEIVNSTPSGFDTMVTVVGEEVALNLDVPKAASLQSPDENFDVKIDTIPLPTPVEDLENGETATQVIFVEESVLDEEIIESEETAEETMTQPLIDALTAELSSAPSLSVRPRGRSLDDAIIQLSPAEEVANNQNIVSSSEEPIQSTRNAPEGPPLTKREKDGLRISVSRCWNRNSLSREAMEVTVTVLFNMSETGFPEGKSIKMTNSFGGSTSAVKIAYKSARRAILICGSRGFDLPEEKYSQWRTIEMVFDPIKMRIK